LRDFVGSHVAARHKPGVDVSPHLNVREVLFPGEKGALAKIGHGPRVSAGLQDSADEFVDDPTGDPCAVSGIDEAE